jgi:hypothetical protein
MKLSEDRYQTLAAQLEQETIASRDREKKIQQLQEEVKPAFSNPFTKKGK